MLGLRWLRRSAVASGKPPCWTKGRVGSCPRACQPRGQSCRRDVPGTCRLGPGSGRSCPHDQPGGRPASAGSPAPSRSLPLPPVGAHISHLQTLGGRVSVPAHDSAGSPQLAEPRPRRGLHRPWPVLMGPHPPGVQPDPSGLGPAPSQPTGPRHPPSSVSHPGGRVCTHPWPSSGLSGSGGCLSAGPPNPRASQAVAGGRAEGERAGLLLRIPRGNQEGPSGEPGARGRGGIPGKCIHSQPKPGMEGAWRG